MERGAAAELVAARLLVAAGYQILERNYRCKAGELDVIARDGDALVFVEVRSRGDDEHGAAAEMVGRRKQHRVIRVARCYLAAIDPGSGAGADPRAWRGFERCRFDVVAITGGEAILLRDAFRV